MQTRTVVGGVIILIGVFAIWRFVANRVDLAKPEAVGTAFFKALKSDNLDRAAKFYVPDGAQSWKDAAATTMGDMQSGSRTRFMESIPDSPVFKSTRKPNAPSNEQTLTAGEASIDMRQIDGKWYVCRAPI